MSNFGRNQSGGFQGSNAQGGGQNAQNPYQGYQQNGWQNQGAVQGGQQPYAPQGQTANPYAQQNPYGQQGFAQNPYMRQGAQGQGANPAFRQQGGQAAQPGTYAQANPYAQPNPYVQQNPYAQQQNAAAGQARPYPGVQQGAGGAFQPNPYAQQGYAQANPYARQGGYVQGQGGVNPVYPPQQGGMPYPQGGQGQMFQQGQVGYQAPPARPRGLVLLEQSLNILLPLAAVVLLIISLLNPSVSVLHYLVLVCAAAGIAWLWMRQAYSRNARIVLSVLLGACMLVTVLGMVLPSPSDSTRMSGGNGGSAMNQGNGSEGGEPVYEETMPPETPAPTPEATVDNSTSQLMESLQSFLYFWEANNIDNMVNYCAPSWRRSVGETEIKTALFQILANRRPLEYTFGSVSGTVNDSSRNVEVTITVDKQTGKDPETYLFRILMLNEDDTWYVDPKSLSSHEEAEATVFSAEITQPPTPQPAAADQILYYNPDGGSYYHADADCSLVGEKYRPLKGQFTYSHINDSAYKNLLPCAGCAAPLRPKE